MRPVALFAMLAVFLLHPGMRAPAQASPPAPADSAQLARAQALSQSGAQADAEPILLDYLKRQPQSARAHALLGLLKYREGVPDKSLDQYSLAAKGGALGADDLRIVALDYLQLHDLPSAEHWLKASIERNPKDWRTWRYL